MRGLPPVDMHAHVETSISAADLDELGAVVFVATRSLDEADEAVQRHDTQTIWGVGCHPGLVGAQRAFDDTRFASLIQKSAYVSEVGLDGASRVPMTTQTDTLQKVLSILQREPRITSIHSYRAADNVLAALESQPIAGAVLHWWLGERKATERAVALGCYFSVNASSVRRTDLLDAIPIDRVLTETDHPFGDRRRPEPRRPGLLDDTELALARHYGIGPADLRFQVWKNLAQLTRTASCSALLPRSVKLRLTAL